MEGRYIEWRWLTAFLRTSSAARRRMSPIQRPSKTLLEVVPTSPPQGLSFSSFSLQSTHMYLLLAQ